MTRTSASYVVICEVTPETYRAEPSKGQEAPGDDRQAPSALARPVALLTTAFAPARDHRSSGTRREKHERRGLGRRRRAWIGRSRTWIEHRTRIGSRRSRRIRHRSGRRLGGRRVVGWRCRRLGRRIVGRRCRRLGSRRIVGRRCRWLGRDGRIRDGRSLGRLHFSRTMLGPAGSGCGDETHHGKSDRRASNPKGELTHEYCLPTPISPQPVPRAIVVPSLKILKTAVTATEASSFR